MRLLVASVSIVPMCTFTIPNSQYVYIVTHLTLYSSTCTGRTTAFCTSSCLVSTFLWNLEVCCLPLDEYSAAKLFEGELVSS